MESPCAAPDNKKKNKMCPSPSAASSRRPDLSSNNKNKMCLMVYISGQPSIFLVDLDFKYDVDANGFADMKPNFRVAGNPPSLYMCVVDATLYLLEMDTPVRPVIYSIDLQQVAEMSDRQLYLNNKKVIKKRATALGPKRHADLVAYRGNIIYFSTLITYEYECDDVRDPHPTDFELFDTKTGVLKKLPRLIVCRMNMSSGFNFKSCSLYDPLKSEHYDPFDACRSDKSESEYFFRILSFVVDEDEDEDTLIVKTDLGSKYFCLKLDGDDGIWRLCEEEDNYVLESGKNIMTRNGICFDDCGASDTRRWLQQSNRARAKKDSVPRYVPFPSMKSEIEDIYGLEYRYYNKGLPSFDLRKVGGDIDDDDQRMLLCTAGQAFKDIDWRLETSEELYVFLQVWKVNLEEFPVYDKENTDKFMSRMTCFKFRVSEQISLPFNFLGGLCYY